MVRSFDEEGLRFIVGVSAFSFSSHRASLTLSFYDWKKKSTGIFACNNNPNLPLFSSLSSSSSSSSKSPSNALVLRRVHRCSNATEALHILLDSIETKHFDNDSARKFDYESLVLDTYKRRALSKVLQMLGNDGQWETVLEYYRKVLFSFTYNELGDDFPSDSLMDITKCAISSLGASKQTNQAVALLHFYLEHFEASEKKAMSINNKLLLIYSTISSCRSSGDWEIALKLFHESEQVISTDTKDSKYQQQHGFRGDLTHNRISGLEVTLTVLAHQKRYQEAIGLLDGLFLKNVTSKLDQSRMLSRPNSSRVHVQLCNLALQACSKALNHTAALRILDRMLQYNRAYHHSNRKEKIQNNSSSSMLLQSFYSAPNIESFEIVISACGKCGAWSDAMLVQNIMNSNEESWPRSLLKALDTSQNGSRSIENKYNWHFQGLPKSGSGKHAWWEIARFKFHAGPNLRIGISPNRNRRRYGFRLQFFSVETGEKIGFSKLKWFRNCQSTCNVLIASIFLVLIKCPTTTDKVLTSSLVGMRVSDSFRNQGLSSLFMAIWLRICGGKHACLYLVS